MWMWPNIVFSQCFFDFINMKLVVFALMPWGFEEILSRQLVHWESGHSQTNEHEKEFASVVCN